MWLFGPNGVGTLVAYDDENGVGHFSLIQVAALAAGTYYLGIREYGNNDMIAAYALRVAWTPRSGSLTPDVWENDNTAAAANAIINGAVQGHSIHVPGDVDWAKFTIGGSGALNLMIDTYQTTPDDTQLWLFGPNSSTACIAYDDNSGPDENAWITAGPLVPGMYYIKIKERGNNETMDSYVLQTVW
jgi:hypothetical protein